jgi:peptidylprolyl isomerase
VMPENLVYGGGVARLHLHYRTLIRRWRSVGLLFMAAAIAGCATVADNDSKPAADPTGEDAHGPILAQMGGVKLTETYFKDLLGDMNPADQNLVRQNPALAEKLLREEILKYYLLDLSKRTGWSLRPEVMRKATQAANQAIAASFLQSKATVKESYPDETLIRKIYEANRDTLRGAGQVRLAQIYIEGQTKQALDEIKRIHQELGQNPEQFESAARRYSQHEPTAANGGDLGWKSENQLVPGLAETVARMRPGDVSAPIGTGQGFHIIRLIGRRQGDLLTLEQARPLIVNQLRSEAASRNEQEYLQSLLKKDPIQLDQEAVKRYLQAPAQPRTGGDR